MDKLQALEPEGVENRRGFCDPSPSTPALTRECTTNQPGDEEERKSGRRAGSGVRAKEGGKSKRGSDLESPDALRRIAGRLNLRPDTIILEFQEPLE